MAHTCPDCYVLCRCGGDIDDIDFGEDSSCTHYLRSECVAYQHDEDYSDDWDEPEEAPDVR